MKSPNFGYLICGGIAKTKVTEPCPYTTKCLVSLQKDHQTCLEPKSCNRHLFEDRDINIFSYGGHKSEVRHRILSAVVYTNKLPTQATDFFLTRCMGQEITNFENEDAKKLTLKSQLESYFDRQFFENVKILPLNTQKNIWRIHIRQYLLPEKLRPKFDARSNTHNALSRYFRLEENLGK